MATELTSFQGIKISDLTTDPAFDNTRLALSADPSTGKLYQVTMEQWVNLLSGIGVAYKGAADSTTNPGTPTDPEYYTATAAGTYTNFKDSGGAALVVASADGFVTLTFNGTAWSKQTIPITDGLPSKAQVNTRAALSFSPKSSDAIAFDATSKIITVSNSLYILNGQSYYRFDAGTVDIGTYLTANPAQTTVYVYFLAPDNFINGSYSGGNALASTLLIKGFADSTSTVRDDNAVTLFIYNVNTGLLSSPFFSEKVLSLDDRLTAVEPKTADLYLSPTLKTYTKLVYSTAADFTWDAVNNILSWSAPLYFFNQSGFYGRVGSGAGSIDFGAAVTANPSAFWFVAYVTVVDGFLLGTKVTQPTTIIVKPWTDDNIKDIQSPENIIIATFYAPKKVVYSPFIREAAQTYFLTNKDTTSVPTVAWKNNFPNVLDKMSGFIGKYFYGESKTAENRTRVIMLGDSLFARENHNSVGDVVPASFPPSIVTKNFSAWLWEQLKGNKPVYNRFDTAGRFTETGTFTTVTVDATWDDSNDRPTDTRLSTSANASVAFTVGTLYNYFNLIDRTDTSGTTAATVAVGGGNGLLLVQMDGSGAWVEANGFSFSQQQTTGTYIGNTLYQRRILFKKAGSGVGASVTVTISKGNDATRLLYWGLEEIPGDKPYIQLLNVARGSHTLAQLQNYYNGDVIDRKPDLVVFEIPLLNMIAADSTLAYNLNWVQDFIWGDRTGNTNTWNLKSASNNWADFQVLVIIPHYGQSYFNTDNSFVEQTSGYTAEEIYQAVKGLLYEKGDVPYIDMANAMMAEAYADVLFKGDYYNAFKTSGHTGTSYLDDGLHANDKGATVWAKTLCPVFWGNTL